MHNPSNPKNSGAWYYGQEIAGWAGLQVTSAHAFGRIHNLSEVNPLNDDMLYRLISKFPIGREPKAFFMSRRSLEQLRKSRVAFHPTGAPVEVPPMRTGNWGCTLSKAAILPSKYTRRLM